MAPQTAPHPCVGSDHDKRKAVAKMGCSSVVGRYSSGVAGIGILWNGHPTRTGIVLGQSCHRSGHPTRMGIHHAGHALRCLFFLVFFFP